MRSLSWPNAEFTKPLTNDAARFWRAESTLPAPMVAPVVITSHNINTWKLEQNGWYYANNISKWIFFCDSISLYFVHAAQQTICIQWFRQRLGIDQDFCIYIRHIRDPSRYAPSQWETSLHCNDVSHWLGAYLDWSLHMRVIHCCRDHQILTVWFQVTLVDVFRYFGLHDIQLHEERNMFCMMKGIACEGYYINPKHR